MTVPTGRREASKQATRNALLAAAKAAFAERGFEATTVRDIASAANVTERTFYRYFDGKEGLIADEFLSWLGILRAQIEGRPAAEPPFVAVERAMMAIGQQAAAGGGPAALWLFRDGPPAGSLRRSAPRPLLRLEASITEAVLARIRAGHGARAESAGDDEYRARVIGRVAVAAFRSAMIRHRELREAGSAPPPTFAELLGQAFAIIGDQFRPGAPAV
jgi:AcrR family transcriptional regulator